MERPGWPMRLADFSLAAKLTLTLFLLLVGVGYLVASVKIYVWHNEADGVPGMTGDDLVASFHGLEKQVTEQVRQTLVPEMLKEVSPGGKMRRHLIKGGEPAEQALVAWLKAGAKEADFAAGTPSPREVIAQRCIECHNAAGEERDLPYAPSASAPPEYTLVAKVAVSPLGPAVATQRTLRIEPPSARELLHTTHAHILVMPVFTLLVAGLFLMTGLGTTIKTVLAPLPLLAICVDIGAWWLARSVAPAAYLVGVAGAIFSIAFGLQILCVLGSMWMGTRQPTAARA